MCVQGLYRYTFNTYNTCKANACLFCNAKKINISSGILPKASYLHIGCLPFRTTEEQNELLAKVYKSERGFSTEDSGGILCKYIFLIFKDFKVFIFISLFGRGR